MPKINFNYLFFTIIGMCIFAETVFAKDAPQQMQDFSFAGYQDGGKKKWDISAEIADIFTDVVKMKNVTGKSYGVDDNFKIEADKGVYSKSKSKLHLQNNVVGTSDSGAKLLTNSLDWDAKQGLITTEDNVRIDKENMQASGKGAVAHQNLNTVALKENVTTNFSRVENNVPQTTVITCDGPLDVDYNSQIAVFNKNVVATDEQGKMYADKMTVYFDTQTKKIKNMVCSGNVKIDNKQNSAYGEVLTYDASGNKAQITGRPRLIFYTQKEDKSGKNDASARN